MFMTIIISKLKGDNFSSKAYKLKTVEELKNLFMMVKTINDDYDTIVIEFEYDLYEGDIPVSYRTILCTYTNGIFILSTLSLDIIENMCCYLDCPTLYSAKEIMTWFGYLERGYKEAKEIYTQCSYCGYYYEEDILEHPLCKFLNDFGFELEKSEDTLSDYIYF